MDINHLREFVVLAQTGNFLEAAEILYISQSSLSKHIQKIEKELGIPLFDRTTRKVKITDYGKQFLPFAEEIVKLQEVYTSTLDALHETKRETLNLGAIPALAQYNITDILVDFKKVRSRSTVNVFRAGSDSLKEMLRQQECSLAFIRSFGTEDRDLVKIPYFVDPLVVVLPENHPLTNRETISLKMLKNEDFILIEKDTEPYNVCIDACHQNGFEPNVVYTDHSLQNLLDMVAKGMGIALLMKQLAQFFPKSGIIIVEISPSVPTQLDLCYLKDIKLSETEKLFIQCAEAQRERLSIRKA